MKLVYKTIIINIIVSLTVLFVGEWSVYAFLKQKINEEAAEHLLTEQHSFIEKLNSGTDIHAFTNNIGDAINIEDISIIKYSQPIIENVVLDEVYEDEEEEAKELFTSKKIIFDITNNHRNYRVCIFKSTDEDEGLENHTLIILFISGIIMLAVIIIINIIVYSKLFSPVYALIRKMNEFSIQKLHKIEAPKTNTYEFQKLAEIISTMSQKNIDGYVVMKEFTENMAHEVQTPLAVISSKIEQCMQDKNLSENQAHLLGEANKSLNKLFNLNKGLSLLSKLDNKQYYTTNQININTIVKERVGYFADFIENKKIQLLELYSNDIVTKMDSALAEVLIDNLLKNAIKHNFENGKIFIKTEGNKLVISNTGEEPTVSTEQFFNRFYSKNANESLGLGLSIVKKIIDYYQFKIDYIYSNGEHQISINF
jgi:signal transduction histidine kinase